MLKSIDINTTQNVSITYELAYLRERVLAFLLDSVLMAVFFVVLAILGGLTEVFSDFEDGWFHFQYLFILPIRSFYTLFFEALLDGQTPGKMMLRIKVVKMDGKQPSFSDFLLRWSFRLIDLWLTFGVLGALLIASTDYGQRLGDIVSNTAVVRVQPRLQVGLRDIMRIDTQASYEPTYKDIRHFREDDILLIKQTIERYNRYRNRAHRDAVLELCETLREKLRLEVVPVNKIDFLKTLIRDYIVLTR